MLGQLSEMLDRLVQAVKILEAAMKGLSDRVKEHGEVLQQQSAEMKALTASIQQL